MIRPIIYIAAALGALAGCARQPPEGSNLPDPTSPAQVLRLTELAGTRSSEVPPGALRIVDINSEVTIAIERGALLLRASQQVPAGGGVDSMAHAARTLAEIVDSGRVYIQAYAEALTTLAGVAGADAQSVARAQEAKRASRTRIVRWAQRALQQADSIPGLRSRFNGAIDALSVGGPPDASVTFRALLQAVEEQAGVLRTLLAAAAAREGLFVQLGATLRTSARDQPIHLEGFDTYQPGTRLVVGGDVIFGPNQVQELNQAAELAKTFNTHGVSGLIAELDTAYSSTIQRQLEPLRACASGLKSARGQLPGASVQLAALIDPGPVADSLRGIIESLSASYGASAPPSTRNPTEFLAETVSLGTRLVGAVAAVENVIDSLRRASSRGPAGGTLWRVLGPAADSCGPVLAAADTAMGDLLAMLKGGSALKRAGAALDGFGNEVTRHTIEQLPLSTTLVLPDVGPRSVGDVVVVRIGAGRGQGSVQLLETWRLFLARTVPYLSSRVGLTFAHPVPVSATALSSSFQAAAAYTVLWKPLPLLSRWSRQNAVYNRLIDFGVGLNVAALDFNKDDAPELGLGVAVSGFRDYLQLGYGYNVQRGVKYWFFGLRLPVFGATSSVTAGGGGEAAGGRGPQSVGSVGTTPRWPTGGVACRRTSVE